MKTSSLCNLRLSVCLKVRARRGGERSGYANASRLLEDTHTQTHIPVSQYESEAPPRPRVTVPLQPASCLLVSREKYRPSPKINPKHVRPPEVKQWLGSKFQFKRRFTRHPALRCDNTDWWRESSFWKLDLTEYSVMFRIQSLCLYPFSGTLSKVKAGLTSLVPGLCSQLSDK